MKRRLVSMSFLALAVVPKFASAFIPPLSLVLEDVFDDRKASKATEIVLRHRIAVRNEPPAEIVEVEERLVLERGRTLSQFRVPSTGLTLAAVYDGKGYAFSGGKTVTSRSGLFLRYFSATGPDEFRDRLIAERFLRRDQMMTYKPGFNPKGDPNGWDLRANYLRHNDVFLQRLKRGIGIGVIGFGEGDQRRTVVFDRARRGIRRLEWRDGQALAAWNFDQFSPFPGKGYHPRKLSFESEGGEKVSSDVLSVRTLTDKQLSDFRARPSGNSADLPSSVGSALVILLGYR